MKKIRLFLMVLACMLLVAATALAVDATAIKLNTQTTVTISNSGDIAYYSYKPTATGNYVFYSYMDENEYGDTYGHLYDSQMNQLASDDEAGGNGMFKINYNLESGKTYYFAARYYGGDTGSFYVKLEKYKGLTKAVAVESNPRVEVGTKAKLEVQAETTEGSLAYQWYVYKEDKNTYEPIENATKKTYQTGTISKTKQYYCTVRDDFGNARTVWFTVGIDNQLMLERVGEYTVSVPYGETTKLEVKASCKNGDLTYEWRKRNQSTNWSNQIIEGATTASLTTEAIQEATEYQCIVRDQYENSYSTSFSVRIENALVAEANGEKERFISPGKTVKLSVKASCTNGSLTYQWAKGTMAQGRDYFEYQDIENATSTSYTTEAINEYSAYYCSVRDEYGNEETVEFYIHIENGMSVEVEGDQEIYVKPGKTAKLKVAASCTKGTLSYKWYHTDTTTWNSEIISGANSATYTTGALQKREEYRCVVSDQYRNTETVWFNVYIDNGFTAEATGETRFEVQKGEKAKLAVTASCDTGDLTYQWYSNTNGRSQQISGATSTSITTDAIQAHTEYYCSIKDQYNNSRSVWFYIGVENHLTVSAVGNTDRYVAPGAKAKLTVTASCDEGELTYKWYKPVYRNDEEWSTQEDKSATKATYTTEAIDRYKQYRCRVTDQFGNYEDVWFYIGVENGLTVSPLGDSSFYVKDGETVTLEVEASCNTGSVTYQWYKEERIGNNWRSNKIAGATKASYTTEATAGSAEYYCQVYDQYRNNTSAYFTVAIENELVVWADGKTDFTVSHGDSVTLKAQASCLEGDLTYRWYENVQTKEGWYTSKQIPDAKTGTLKLTNIQKAGEYYCEVTDKYNSRENVWFYVSVENGFFAEATTETRFEIEPGAKLTFGVSAGAETGDMTFQWYKENYNSVQEYWTDEIIPGATSETYTTEANEKNHEYFCRVTDVYGNRRDVWFNAVIVNDLELGISAKVNGETVKVENGYLAVPEGAEVVLTGKATFKQGTVQYKWSGGGTAATYSKNVCTIKNVSKYMYLTCKVLDEYDNTKTQSIVISVDNSLKAEPVGKVVRKVSKGDSVTMSVKASATTGKLKYAWTFNGRKLDDTTKEITATAENAGVYRCTVTDAYGSTAVCDFFVYMTSTTLKLDETVEVTAVTGNRLFLAFKPTKSGAYNLTCSECTIVPTINAIASDGSYTTGRSYYMNQGRSRNAYLYAGVQYYFVLSVYRERGFSASVKLTEAVPDDIMTAAYTLRPGQSGKVPFKDVKSLASSNEDVLTVSGTTVTAKAKGSAEVTVTYKNGDKAKCHFDVLEGTEITLPSALTTIEEDAFAGNAMSFLKLNQKTKNIGERAFAYCKMKQLIVPAADIEFAENALTGAKPTILCPEGSKAAEFASKQNIPYLYVE